MTWNKPSRPPPARLEALPEAPPPSRKPSMLVAGIGFAVAVLVATVIWLELRSGTKEPSAVQVVARQTR